jgi:hypothetical protein
MPYLGGMQPASPPYSPTGAPPSSTGAPPTETAPAAAGPAKARTGLIVLAAIVTEVVLIAAGANQWVSDRLARAHLTSDPVLSGTRYSVLTYSWRFTPLKRDPEHFYAGSWTLVGTTIVLSALLIAAVVRGPVTFDRAFFGAWMAVPVATMLGGYARAFVLDVPAQNAETRVSRALFGALAPGSTVFIAGLALGLVVAIVVAIVAMTTRRRPMAPAAGPAGYPEAGEGGPGSAPWQDRYYGPPPQTYGGAAGAGQPQETSPYPSMRKDDAGSTTRLPDVGEPGGGGAGLGAVGAGAAMGAAALAGRDRDGEQHAGYEQQGGDQDTQGWPAQQGWPEQQGEQERQRWAEQQGGQDQQGAQGQTGEATTVLPRLPDSEPAADQPGSHPAAAEEPARQEPAREEPAREEPAREELRDEAVRNEPPADQPTMQFPRPPDDEDMHPDR